MSNEAKRTEHADRYGNQNRNETSSKTSLPKDKPIAYAGPEQIVYEGSEVKLDGRCNLDIGSEPNPAISYIWELVKNNVDTLPSIELNDQNTKSPSFKAPYVEFDFNKGENNKPYVNLSFKLVAIDKTSGLSSEPSFVRIIIKMVQRALVLQGGGALGAYELGVYRALCERLIEKDRSTGSRKNRPLFDIIAGTSIGALNAALIVHSVKKRMDKVRHAKDKLEVTGDNNIPAIWEGSLHDLTNFWCDITISFPWFNSEQFKKPWDWLNYVSKSWLDTCNRYVTKYSLPPDLKNNYLNPFYLFFRPENYSPAATGESARRYFSMLYFPYIFPMHAITPSFMQPDTRFFLGIPSFFRFSNTPLVETVEGHYWKSDKHPLRTSFEDGEPRLLLVASDVLDATSAVTFDSYLGETKYEDGRHQTNNSPDTRHSQHVISYPQGITMQHVKASMSPNSVLETSTIHDKVNDDTRYFWDGAYLSNTPLRELLHLHRYYLYDTKKNSHQCNDENPPPVPHLEVYLINLYPTVEKQAEPPKDADTIQDRELDMKFHDKTKYDKKVAEMITDYLILNGQIKNLAKKYIGIFEKDKLQEFEEEYKKILNTKTHSTKRKKTEKRTFRDLVDGRFDISRVIYIDRKDDTDTIFGKAADFSRESMINLEKEGYSDAQKALEEHPDLIVSKDSSYKVLRGSCLS
jgi:predicted acylesterase/phospholipase RssA